MGNLDCGSKFSLDMSQNRGDTVLPNIYKFPLTGLPENESYSEHGDDHTCKFSLNIWEGKPNNFNVLNSTCVKVAADAIRSQGYLQRKVRNIQKSQNSDFE